MFFDMSFQENVKTRFLNFEKSKIRILEKWFRPYGASNRI